MHSTKRTKGSFNFRKKFQISTIISLITCSQGLQSRLTELKQKHDLISEELEKMKMEKSARLGTYETELDMIFDKVNNRVAQ